MPERIRVRLEPDEMLADFDRIQSLIQIAKNRFPKALMISYEELAQNRRFQMKRIQTYLGLVPRRLHPATIKTGCPMSDSIENYDEVMAVLIKHGYERFLLDPQLNQQPVGN